MLLQIHFSKCCYFGKIWAKPLNRYWVWRHVSFVFMSEVRTSSERRTRLAWRCLHRLISLMTNLLMSEGFANGSPDLWQRKICPKFLQILSILTFVMPSELKLSSWNVVQAKNNGKFCQNKRHLSGFAERTGDVALVLALGFTISIKSGGNVTSFFDACW